MKNNVFYHISPIENKDSILKNGLISTSSEIFVCNEFNQLRRIAHGQLGISEYSIFKIPSSNITGEILNDDVAEFGAQYQFIVKQDIIESKCISHVEDVKWHPCDLAEVNNREFASFLGMDVDKLMQEMVQHNKEWCEHFNKKYNLNIDYVPLNMEGVNGIGGGNLE
ncbi:hypothetical protein [Flavobacterium flavigenum]|uniref:hypothetical protein n=1 Tax=Flavobacterium flavigenum TaxID=3003258 RepID=UPI0022AC088E|nr:hypothetical protein [Flavobacterium flavigenum]